MEKMPSQGTPYVKVIVDQSSDEKDSEDRIEIKAEWRGANETSEQVVYRRVLPLDITPSVLVAGQKATVVIKPITLADFDVNGTDLTFYSSKDQEYITLPMTETKQVLDSQLSLAEVAPNKIAILEQRYVNINGASWPGIIRRRGCTSKSSTSATIYNLRTNEER